MPTNHTDQAYAMDPFAPPPVGSTLNSITINILDRNDNGIIGPASGSNLLRDQVNGSAITGVYNGDTVTVRLPDNSVVTISGVTFYTANGGRFFTPTDGTVLQNGVTFLSSTFVSATTSVPVSNLLPICFTPGTLILTPCGQVPVERLEVGDPVLTRDHGPQPLRWIGRRRHSGRGIFAPVRIMAGALGNGRDLIVSQQHRILLSGWRAELLFGETEVLVAAKHLVNGDTIHLAPCDEVEYLHIMFDCHEIVSSEGIPSESFYADGIAARRDPEIRTELAVLFPGLAVPTSRPALPVARLVLRAHEARLLMT